MVAVIHSGKSLRGALNYNEQKAKKGKAICVTAQNYPKNAEDLNFYQKLSMLTNLAALRPRTQQNCVHISLNFDPTEMISREKMNTIALDYMQQIGFGDQPFLVYQHKDSSHPHLHIVTTNITSEGKRIDLHNLGKTKSEHARQQLEEKYGLIKASSKNVREVTRIPKIDAQKVVYGQSETKRAITNVLDKVVEQYHYTSLAELNAVLGLYNVKAERGKEDSRLYIKGGLLYRVLDDKGNAVGVPIKASTIYSKPTLKVLEEHFGQNKERRKPHRQQLKNKIDWVLHNRQITIPQLIAELRKEGVSTLIRKNGDGLAFGITFVDHKTKCVFNGSDIGKEYSLAAIKAKCVIPVPVKQHNISHQHISASDSKHPLSIIPNNIISSAPQPDTPPGDLRFTKKKKKKRRVRL